LENWPSFNICILLKPTCMVRYFYPHINCLFYYFDLNAILVVYF
jgi:hypothetical protein